MSVDQKYRHHHVHKQIETEGVKFRLDREGASNPY